MDNKRLLIAFLLSFVFIWGYRYTLSPPPAPPDAATGSPQQQAAPATATAPAAPSAAAPVIEGAEALPVIQADAAEDVRIMTDHFTSVWSNAGGVLKSFRLQEYLDSEERPLELINTVISDRVGWPLAIVSGDAALDEQLAEALFRVRRQEGDREITFEYAANGIEARKTLTFEERPYVIRVTTSLTRDGMPVPHEVVMQGGFGDQSIPPNPAYQKAIYGDGSDYTRTLLSSIDEPEQVTTPIAGVEDRYFLAAFIRADAAPARISKTDYRMPDGTEARSLYVSTPGGEPLDVYIGPKQTAALTAADPRLAEVPDYGWFGFFTRPLISLLMLIHSFVGNWGWSIVLLTLLINVAMFPLRVKQQVSMHKMQKLAPQMRSLQDKYKKLKPGDPKRAEVEAELMKMNKEQMAGCLPALLQMPLLFAFWSMLSVSIELRHAPWMLWINDLSQHDPYYILPILMGISMFAQQRMMPTTMDPAQAKMMMLMPIIFLGFFLWAQSGVVLYWFTSNLIGIIQQWVIKKYWHPEQEARTQVRPRNKMA